MNTRRDLTDLPYRLIQRAARKAPAALVERLEEEWLADLDSRSGAVSRLRLAIGCCWATGVITRDFRVPQLAASGASAAHKQLLPHGLRPDLPVLSRRTVTFIVIAAAHVLVIYGFTSGLAQHVVASIPQLTHAVFLDESQPAHPRPPAIDFRPSPVRTVELDPPDPRTIDYSSDEAPGPGVITPRQPEPAALPPKVSRVWGGPGKGFPTTDDYYPPTLRRLGETGAATVGVCVDSQGRLTADPTLVATSGSRRIDDGALNLAKAGSGHYRPTIDDGQPVSACYSYRIRFELN